MMICEYCKLMEIDGAPFWSSVTVNGKEFCSCPVHYKQVAEMWHNHFKEEHNVNLTEILDKAKLYRCFSCKTSKFVERSEDLNGWYSVEALSNGKHEGEEWVCPDCGQELGFENE